jgi:serine/threonine protein kinase
MADVTEKLERLAALLDRELITRDQFEKQRDALLAEPAPSAGARPTSVGSYRVTGEIGQGGMGVVYRGRHRSETFAERQGGDVAIKVLHAQYASRADIVERFEREAELGVKLDHPGIVRVHELTVDAGRVALVMELVGGRPLSEMIGNETGPIPWVRARPMLEQLLDAVSYAHGQGVIHRDLKPENVMVGSEGQLKVLDFGIAKDTASGRTQTGTGMGTIDYMAPEQYLDAKAVDARADIYALGMTLYEMLAGRLPWSDSDSEFSILERKKNGDIVPPTEFYPDIPPGVVAMVMRMLEPGIGDRYADVRAIRDGLGKLKTQVSPPERTSLLEGPYPRLPGDDVDLPRPHVEPSKNPRSQPGAPSSVGSYRMKTGSDTDLRRVALAWLIGLSLIMLLFWVIGRQPGAVEQWEDWADEVCACRKGDKSCFEKATKVAKDLQDPEDLSKLEKEIVEESRQKAYMCIIENQ